MNIIDLVLCLVLLLAVWNGWRRGLILQICSVVALVAAIYLAARYGSMVAKDDLFIMPDSFGDPLEPNFDCTFAKYTPMDVDYIRSKMDKYPDKRVWLISHWFEPGQESEEFKELLGQGLFYYCSGVDVSPMVSLREKANFLAICTVCSRNACFFCVFPDLFLSFVRKRK